MMLRPVTIGRARLSVISTVCSVLVLGGLFLVPRPSPVAAQATLPPSPSDTSVPIPAPGGSIVVNIETGEVLSAHNEHARFSPASITKILTVLLARQKLKLDQDITISPTASLAPPRDLGVVAGEKWKMRDLLFAAMLCSCNDAAWALGDTAGGGSMDGYTKVAGDLAASLGMTDQPVFRDPAGLDDERSVGGGNLMSARDIAIASRAYMADDELAFVAASPRHDWVGGDGKPHVVMNHNSFLKAYPGATGLKTGYTSKADHTFVGTATRNGVRLMAVVLYSNNAYAHAKDLLNGGFLLHAAKTPAADKLPPVPETLHGETALSSPTTTVQSTTSAESTTTASAVSPPSPSTSSPSETDDISEPIGSLSMRVGATVLAVFVVLAFGLVIFKRRTSRSRVIDRRPARPRRTRRRGSGSGLEGKA